MMEVESGAHDFTMTIQEEEYEHADCEEYEEEEVEEEEFYGEEGYSSPDGPEESVVYLPTKEERMNVIYDAAFVGQTTRLREKIVESVSTGEAEYRKSKQKEEWQLKSGIDAGATSSTMTRVITEAAVVGRMKFGKTEKVFSIWEEDEAEAETVAEIPASSSSARAAPRRRSLKRTLSRKPSRLVELFIAEQKHKKEVEKLWSVEKTLERIEGEEDARKQYQEGNEFSNLPTATVPKFQRTKVKHPKNGKIRDVVIREAAAAGLSRTDRLREVKELKITHQCFCTYCQNPSPYQTQAYKKLAKKNSFTCQPATTEATIAVKTIVVKTGGATTTTTEATAAGATTTTTGVTATEATTTEATTTEATGEHENLPSEQSKKKKDKTKKKKKKSGTNVGSEPSSTHSKKKSLSSSSSSALSSMKKVFSVPSLIDISLKDVKAKKKSTKRSPKPSDRKKAVKDPSNAENPFEAILSSPVKSPKKKLSTSSQPEPAKSPKPRKSKSTATSTTTTTKTKKKKSKSSSMTSAKKKTSGDNNDDNDSGKHEPTLTSEFREPFSPRSVTGLATTTTTKSHNRSSHSPPPRWDKPNYFEVEEQPRGLKYAQTLYFTSSRKSVVGDNDDNDKKEQEPIHMELISHAKSTTITSSTSTAARTRRRGVHDKLSSSYTSPSSSSSHKNRPEKKKKKAKKTRKSYSTAI